MVTFLLMVMMYLMFSFFAFLLGGCGLVILVLLLPQAARTTLLGHMQGAAGTALVVAKKAVGL